MVVKVIPRARRSTSVVCLAALVVVVLVLFVTAYYPFRWDPPRVVHNDVTRSAGGALRFGEMNRARTPGTPEWLTDARRSNFAEVELDVNPQSSQEQSPASIMMLARDYWHTDFAIGQNHSELLVWLRRPGSDQNGNPAFAVHGALRSQQWNRVEVMLRDDGIQIDVNGTRRLAVPLPRDSLGTWSAGQIALGGEVHGGGPWQGKIRQAQVRTPGHAVDYIRPGELSIPARYLYFPDHVAPFPPLGRGEWEAVFVHFLSFIPVGFLIVWARRPPVRPIPATLLAAALAVGLGAGKLLFHGRHTEAADLVMQTAGALLGAVLAWRWAHPPAPERPGSTSGAAGPRIRS